MGQTSLRSLHDGRTLVCSLQDLAVGVVQNTSSLSLRNDSTICCPTWLTATPKHIEALRGFPIQASKFGVPFLSYRKWTIQIKLIAISVYLFALTHRTCTKLIALTNTHGWNENVDPAHHFLRSSLPAVIFLTDTQISALSGANHFFDPVSSAGRMSRANVHQTAACSCLSHLDFSYRDIQFGSHMFIVIIASFTTPPIATNLCFRRYFQTTKRWFQQTLAAHNHTWRFQRLQQRSPMSVIENLDHAA